MSDLAITTSRRRPRFARAANAPPFQITERDIEIVQLVAQHRFLRSTHISRLLNASHKKILERLSPLYHGGYLDRPRAQLEYHVRGGGSAPLVYALGSHGARLLATRGDSKFSDQDWTHKNRDSGREFILHTLAVADVSVALLITCQARNDITIQNSNQLLESLPEQTRRDLRPWALRVRVHHDGATREIGLLPDYVFALYFPDGRRRPFVVECDRGTMPVERSTLDQTSMLRKFLAYEAARQQHLHTSRFGWQNFRVLTVTTNAERIATMCAAIHQTATLKSSPLFLFACQSSLPDVNILKHPWLDATGKSHTLI